jgi:hypothetical protein|tara:strand:- start:2961 stop:3416 length:456 start_codon:yes stop_codon:yes gene_type:complete
MNYSDLRWSIIQEWNSDAKFTNENLIELGAEVGVEIRNVRADRKSIVAKVVDGIIAAGVESGEYEVSDMGEDSDTDLNFKRYMGDLTIPAPTVKFDNPPITTPDEVVEVEKLPDFKKMSKKKLDDWALDRGIELDRRQTKTNMIIELNKKI